MYHVCSDGRVWKLWKNWSKLVTPVIGYDGYIRIRTNENGVRTNHYVHRLVAEKYIPNPLGLKEVDHLDGDRSNNNVENLEWVTSQENNRRRKYVKVVQCFKDGIFIKEYECARDTEVDGFSYRNVSQVCLGQKKTHLGHTFKFKGE